MGEVGVVGAGGGGGGGGGRGAYAASQTTVLHNIKRLNQTECPIFVILYVFCYK